MAATAKSLTGMAATGTKTMSNVLTQAKLEEEYRAEKQRNVQLRAALIRLEHLERVEYGEEPPKDILPLPKPGDRPYSQEVYCNQSGRDSFFTGLSKRTPIGGFFAS